MKMISDKEYDDLTTYMHPRLLALWEHENKIRQEHGREEINSFQLGFPKNEIYHHHIEGSHNFYIVFNNSCHNLLQTGITKALDNFPEKFGTSNAKDVVDALYEASAYKLYDKKENYIRFLSETTCCYVVYANGDEFGDILRLDMFRCLDENKVNPNVYDFTGGLMHVLKHFSYYGRNLSTGNDVFNVFDIEDLVYLIAMAFRLKEGDGKHWEATQELSNGSMKAIFYKEEKTGIYFIKTYHRI